jgi:glycosyltransferase involved in cell wall biosynthesis
MSSCAYISPLIAAKLAGVKKIIAHSHNSSADKDLLKKVLHYINKPFLRFLANSYFSCSKEAAKWLFTKSLRSKAIEIKNAINAEDFAFNSEKREQTRQKLGVENKFVIGHIGRFVEQKNHTFLIDIFTEIYKRDKNSVLILAGNGPLEDKIKEKVNKAGLKNAVYFLGVCKHAADLYQAMDVFILPSLSEGLPFCAVEAQCSGLLCFVSDAVSKETVIINTKILPLAYSAESLAEIIINSSDDFIRQNAAEAIEKAGFDVKSILSTLTKYYKL